MRALLLLTFMLAGCGPKALMLPEDPVQRAATCGVVAAAGARQGTNIEAKLSFEAQSRILHYALLEGATGERFDSARAARVANAMPALTDEVTDGKWQGLQGSCDQAYPATKQQAVELPQDRLTAQLGCDGLADFVTTALREGEASYIDRIRALDNLQRKLDGDAGTLLQARGISPQRGVELRTEAMAKLVKLGPPDKVLDRCVAQFGT